MAKINKFFIINCLLCSVLSCELKSAGWGHYRLGMIERLMDDPNFRQCNYTVAFKEKDASSLITPQLAADCLRRGRRVAAGARARGLRLARAGVTLAGTTPALLHFFSSRVSEEARMSADAAYEMLTATKLMQSKICSCTGMSPRKFLQSLESARLTHSSCTPCALVRCARARRYRAHDGSCNNLARPHWGRRNTPFTRIAKPRYSDGVFAVPTAISGRELPNARMLSTRIFADRPTASCVLSYMNMQWGQLVTHDMSLQIMEVTEDGGIQCCQANGAGLLPPSLLHDACVPVYVPDSDAHYEPRGVRCLNLVRSVTAPRPHCALGHADQMNTVSSYLDGSVVYGAESGTARTLRSLVGGRMRVEGTRVGKEKGMLPSVRDKASVCDLRNSSEPCYLAGDVRINQTPSLAMLQTLMVREHNRVSAALCALNPTWTDERVYQEARRVVVAEMQHITYQEWLPLNFGEKYMRAHRVCPAPASLYSRDYDKNVNAGTINGFGAAAFRFLHTLVPPIMQMCPASYKNVQNLRISDHFFNPTVLESSRDSFDSVLRGTLRQSSMEADPSFSREITNYLFKSSNNWGLDLVALDIQRGRDHGLASYNEYRSVCGLPKAKTFQELVEEISQDRINILRQFYESVDDIDLFVGGALETDLAGSLVGPTFQCIIAEQFYRTRIGDRFFYDNADMPHSFTPEQVKELKKSSMARLVCDNSDGVRLVQRRAFELESAWNPLCDCRDSTHNGIPQLDFTHWKDLNT